MWFQLGSLEQDLLMLPSPTPANVDNLLQSYHDKVVYTFMNLC